jgi:putative addiction module killer protein
MAAKLPSPLIRAVQPVDPKVYAVDYTQSVLTIKPLPEFTAWLAGLADAAVRGTIAARIARLAHGLPGDVQPVGDGVSELRIHIGAGWRVYFVQRGRTLIVLLCGGTKRTQQRDITRAKGLAAKLE